MTKDAAKKPADDAKKPAATTKAPVASADDDDVEGHGFMTANKKRSPSAGKR